jgi:hypothetical protein
MADDVGIRMPDQSARMLDPEPPQQEREALTQPMRVVTDSHPHLIAPLLRINEDPLLLRAVSCRFNEDRSVFPAARLSRRMAIGIPSRRSVLSSILRKNVSRSPTS